MANQKISQLTEKTMLDWWEEIPFAENWENGKITTENLKEQILDEALPSQEWNNWKFLKTNWEEASRETVDALPSQTWQAWKVLTTNWTEASWETPTWWIENLPGSPIEIKYKWYCKHKESSNKPYRRFY